MASQPVPVSDDYWDERRTDILHLAREFGIRPDMLEQALKDAVDLLNLSRNNVRPANKKALRGLADQLAGMVDRVSEPSVRERLNAMSIDLSDVSEDDELGFYTSWSAAIARVDRAIDGLKDMVAIVRVAEAGKLRSGRPTHEDWTVAISSLVDFWTYCLHRKVSISGHAADPRGTKPSPLLKFSHRSMQILGEKITEQTCRTVLQNLTNGNAVRWKIVAE